MIIKKYIHPKLSLALSFFAASGCLAAIPNYVYAVQNESHEKISLRNQRTYTYQQPQTPSKPKASTQNAGKKELTAEDYRARLAAIRESYTLIAESSPYGEQGEIEEERDWGDNNEGAQDMNPSDFDAEDKLSPEEETLETGGGFEEDGLSARYNRNRADDLIAESTPYGEQGEYELDQDWGNNKEGAEDMDPSDFDAVDQPSLEQEQPGEEFPLDGEPSLMNDGILSRRNSHRNDYEQVAQASGRREESLDVRRSSQNPSISDIDRSSISTDNIRRSRIPKTSTQTRRQRDATNSLRSRVVRVHANQPNDLPYYEDYLNSVADQYENVNREPEIAPERKPYTKPRRRPVNQGTSGEQSASTVRVTSKTPAPPTPIAKQRNHLKEREAVVVQTTEIPAPRVVQKKGPFTRFNAIQTIKQTQTEPQTYAVATVVQEPTPISTPEPTPPIHRPVVLKRAPKTYIPHDQSLGPNEEEEEFEEETTSRDDRPNWYDRIDAQRHERRVQRRVRELDGEAPPQRRGYPSIPQYTQGNTTPES